MKIKLALILALASSSVSAQSNSFEGFELGLGLSHVKADVEYTDTSLFHLEWDDSDTVAQAHIGYNWSINEKWLLGAGFSHTFNDIDAGINNDLSGNVLTKLNNHSAIYIQPTYILSDSSAIFVKLGYHKAKVSITSSAAFWTDDRYSIHGIGYGIGYKHAINTSFFVQAELDFVDYSDKSFQNNSYDYTQETQSATISLGYSF
jgi:opacity protein-like surface antigen